MTTEFFSLYRFIDSDNLGKLGKYEPAWLSLGDAIPLTNERTNPRLLLYSERNWPKTGSNPIVVVLYVQSDRFCLRLVNRQLFCRRLFTPRERIMSVWRGERGEQAREVAVKVSTALKLI